ncbi:unnamed protein product [Trichogramma brassicae]|uniref:Uncharacterized protein n=1 Tax=Trichogramma brassicae TaxID=86971 RepID=A0A6H5J103_9HYME|nr:unnamed protein product [Trichogramma brassicae]
MSEKKSIESCVLLQSTTYPLNASCTKMGTVGLEFRNGEYKPAVQVSNAQNLYKGIVLDRDAWEMIRSNIHKMIVYTYQYSQDDQVVNTPERAEINGYSLEYTTAYKLKSVQLTRNIFEPVTEKCMSVKQNIDSGAASSKDTTPPQLENVKHVPPQSNSPPGSVLETDHAGVQLANGRGRTPLLHAWLKNTVTAGIWIPGARVPPNRVSKETMKVVVFHRRCCHLPLMLHLSCLLTVPD